MRVNNVIIALVCVSNRATELQHLGFFFLSKIISYFPHRTFFFTHFIEANSAIYPRTRAERNVSERSCCFWPVSRGCRTDSGDIAAEAGPARPGVTKPEGFIDGGRISAARF